VTSSSQPSLPQRLPKIGEKGLHPRPARAIRRVIGSLIAGLLSRIYSPQITVGFPVEQVVRHTVGLPMLPEEYSMIVPKSEHDLTLWANLLNEEPSFGFWTAIRLRNEILSKLVSPSAASLILHRGRGIACVCAIDGSTPRKRIAYGMYLYVTPRYRARTALSRILTITAFNSGRVAGYRNLWANTFPDRLSALAVYLSIGCRPIHRTLSSVLQWRAVTRRLGPAVERMKRRNDR
jgi:hypothetical protein